jgi:hypothetical protein
VPAQSYFEWYPQTNDGVGFYVDDIELRDVERVIGETTTDVDTHRTFDFTPDATGSYGLQARATLWQGYPALDWGPVKRISVLSSSPLDTDGDGDPDITDTDDDGDGMADQWELDYGFDPLDPADAHMDADSDGLSNRAEHDAGTDPRQSDTDGDGHADGEDVAPLDRMNPIPPEALPSRGGWRVILEQSRP